MSVKMPKRPPFGTCCQRLAFWSHFIRFIRSLAQSSLLYKESRHAISSSNNFTNFFLDAEIWKLHLDRWYVVPTFLVELNETAQLFYSIGVLNSLEFYDIATWHVLHLKISWCLVVDACIYYVNLFCWHFGVLAYNRFYLGVYLFNRRNALNSGNGKIIIFGKIRRNCLNFDLNILDSFTLDKNCRLEPESAGNFFVQNWK